MPNLKPLEGELRKLQNDLSADRQKWRNERGEHNRTIVKQNATIRVNEEKLATQTTELAELEGKKKTASSRLATLDRSIKEAKQRISGLEDAETVKRDSLEVLEGVIATAQQQIDTNCAEYEALKTTEANERINTLHGKATVASDALIVVEAELETKRSALESLALQMQETKQKAEAEVETIRAEATKLGTTLESLQTFYDELQSKVKEAQYACDQANAARAKAEIEHGQFKKYEQRARAELNAKDKSLQDRQADIATSEQFLRNKRSFLPEL